MVQGEHEQIFFMMNSKKLDFINSLLVMIYEKTITLYKNNMDINLLFNKRIIRSKFKLFLRCI